MENPRRHKSVLRSFPKEVDTSSAIERAFKLDKTVVVPHVDWKNRSLLPVILPSLDCETRQDRYGLRYPVHGKKLPVSEIELIIVPGVGFDTYGNRLGHGSGFYDRFLSGNGFNGFTCGLAMEEQVVDQIPVFEYDVSMKMLVTNRQIRRFWGCY